MHYKINEKMTYSAVTKLLNKLFKGKLIEDGVYDVSNVDCYTIEYPLHKIDGKQRKDEKISEDYIKLINEIEAFVAKYPNACLASAFETEKYIILSELPTKIIDYKGSGFSHGSTNLIENCPSKLLILQAEKEIYFPKPKQQAYAYGAQPVAEEDFDDDDYYDEDN